MTKDEAIQLATSKKQTCILSMPPSANQLWRTNRKGFMRKSEEARVYYHTAGYEAVSQGIEIFDGPLAITIMVYRARRSGDLDNRIKPTLDALEGIAFNNDNQVIELHAYRFDDKKNPRIEVTIEQVK